VVALTREINGEGLFANINQAVPFDSDGGGGCALYSITGISPVAKLATIKK